MTAVWARARAELRRRWKATLALGLLVALVGAVVLTAVAGARRSASAYERFRKASGSADLLIVAYPDPDRLEQVKRLPQVEALARLAIFSIRPEGSDIWPGSDFFAVGGSDGAFLSTVDRVRAVQGRQPDPGRPDEIGVSEGLAGKLFMYDALATRSYVTQLPWNPDNPLNGRNPTITDLSSHEIRRPADG